MVGKNFNVEFKAGISNPQEERCQQWTTHDIWFHDWEKYCQYRFGNKEGDEDIIPDDQQARINNLNETSLTIDGGSKKQDGRPIVTFYDGVLPWNDSI